MPIFRVEAPDGTRFTLEGDSAPTEAELEEVFRGITRQRITADVEAKTAAAEPSDTLSKSAGAYAGGMIRAVSDPIAGAESMMDAGGSSLGTLLRFTPGGQTIRGVAEAMRMSGAEDAATMAEGVARDTKGSETAAALAGAIGSGVGSAPSAMIPGVGMVSSAVAAGLGSYESTRREALKVFLQAGLDPEEAEKSAHRVALKAGVITGGVTGAFNRWGPGAGLGRGVERGLSSGEFRDMTLEELKRSSLRPMVRQILKEGGGEGTEEAVDQTLQEAFVQTELDPSKTLWDAVKDVAKAGALGFAAGTAIGGPGAAAQVIGERQQAIRGISRGVPPKLRADDVVSGPITGTQQAVERAGSDPAPEAAPESADAPSAKPTRKPGLLIEFTTTKGKPGTVEGAPGDSIEAAKDYLSRIQPGARIDRIEVVPEPEPTSPAMPEEEEGGGSNEEGDQEGRTPEGVLTPAPTEEQGADVVATAPDSAGAQETITGRDGETAPEMTAEREERPAPADPIPATTPQAPRRNRGIEAIRSLTADRPADLLDWIEDFKIRTKSRASAGTLPYYDNGYDDARSGIGRKAFSADGLEADVVAQAAYNAGQIDEPTIDALWMGLGGARRGRAEWRRTAFKENRAANQAGQDAERFARAAIDGKRAVNLPNRKVQPVMVDDLMPGDTFELAGEKVVVEDFEFDPQTDEMTGLRLKDGRKFGTQTVAAGTMLQVDGGTLQTRRESTQAPNDPGDMDAPFSIRRDPGQDDFFGAPESVADQKARMAREAAEAKRRKDRQDMLDRQAAPIVGRPVDTTGDMFDPLGGDAPLFSAKPSKPANPRPDQGSLFSTRSDDGAAPSLGRQRAQAVLDRLGIRSGRVVLVDGRQRHSSGAVVEGALAPDGRILLYPDNLRDESDLRRVLRHEALHDVFSDPAVAEVWNRLRATYDQAARRRKVEGEGYTSHQDEEGALDEVEARVDRRAPLFRRFIGSIVRALYRRGQQDLAGAVFGLDRLADADARALVGYAMRLDQMAGKAAFGDRFSLGSPENREQRGDREDGDGSRDRQAQGSNPAGAGGRTAPDSLISAANVARGDGRPTSQTRAGSRDNSADQVRRLAAYAKARNLVVPKSSLPSEFLGRGQEVAVWRVGNRVHKVTHPNRFGFGLEGAATPAEYLERLNLQNQVFGDDIRLEGFIDEDGDFSVVTSQRFVEGERPSDAAIHSWLASKGFEPVSGIGGELGWYRGEDNTYLADAHSGNLFQTSKGIVPIDVLAFRPEGAIRRSLREAVGLEDDEAPRFSLRLDPEERRRQQLAGRAMTPTQAVLARDATEVRERIGWEKPFSKFAAAMVEQHGEEVRPWLSKAWEHATDARLSIQNNLSPEAQAAWNQIEGHAEVAPQVGEKKPLPVYDPEKVARWWNPFVRPSDVVRYFGGDDLLRKRQLLDMRTAYQSAAVKAQADTLREQLEESFWGAKARAIPRFLRPFFPKAKLRRFMRFALPIAARLNVTGGAPGAWTFAAFDQRAGFMPEAEANRQGIRTGDKIWRANSLDGSMETLTLGAKMELENGTKGFQILRRMDEKTQAEVYQRAVDVFPEFQWFLDTWLNPALKDTRVTVNGVEIPVFNRFALAGRYAQGDPKFASREAYTPDVTMGTGLIGAIRKFRKERRVTFKEGTVSPGRKYETGSAREMGNTLDLLSGFNVRAMQVLQEDVRKEWMRDVLASASDVPREGLPESWVPIENAMADVWRAVQTLRKFDDPLNFPQTTERMRDDDSPAYKQFFGEILRLRNSDAPKMVPKPLVDALVQQFAATKELGLIGHIARIWARNWKAFLLLMPDTFVENRTDNYLRFLIQAHRQLVLSALRGGDRLAFREARKLAWAGISNMVPGMRPFLGLNDNALFKRMADDVLPPELFEGGTRLQDLWIEKGTTDEEIASNLEMGQRGRAAAVALRDLGPLVLEKTGYGKMDVAAKRQFVFTTLLARAEHEAQRQGLKGAAAEQFIEGWMMAPPEDAKRRAIEGANRLLLHYGDTPGWLARIARLPVINTFVAFPLFRYHFLGREIDRATSFFRAAHRAFIRGKKLTREEWAASLADLISYATLPAMGYGAAAIAGALADSMIGGDGGDDDDDPREIVGSSSVFVTDENGETKRKPLPRELVTANRLNVSALLRSAGVPLEGEKDYWWHIKDYPIVRSAALFYLAANDARRQGFGSGMATMMGGLRDMLTSLAGAGQAIKVPAKIAAEIQGEESGRPAFTSVDPFATAVPLDAYITLQALNLIPGQRQANEVLKWLDPVPRRVTRSKELGYDPGVTEALQAEGWTGLADRVGRGITSGDFASPLPPQGRINRRFGFVEEPREFDLESRIAAAFGQNIKPIPRTEYEEALRK